MAARTLNKLTLTLPDNIISGMEDHWFNRQLQNLRGGHMDNFPVPINWLQIIEVTDTKMVIMYESNTAHDRTCQLKLERDQGETSRVEEDARRDKMAKRGPGRPRVDA